MKTKSLTSILVVLVAICLTAPGSAQTPTYKMTTQIPANV